MYSVKVVNPDGGFRIYQCGGPVELQYGDTSLRVLLSDPDTRIELPRGHTAYVLETGVTIEIIKGQSRPPASEEQRGGLAPAARAGATA